MIRLLIAQGWPLGVLKRPIFLVVTAVLGAACTGAAEDSPTNTEPPAVTISTTPAPITSMPALTGPRTTGAPWGHRTRGLLRDARPLLNGFKGNDTGGIDPAAGLAGCGFLPADTGLHHGGGLPGLTEGLDYISGLGMEAISITPPLDDTGTIIAVGPDGHVRMLYSHTATAADELSADLAELLG